MLFKLIKLQKKSHFLINKKKMEIDMTYDDLFNNFFGLSNSYLANVVKVSKMSFYLITTFFYYIYRDPTQTLLIYNIAHLL